jgi:hypothetical protein
MPTPITTAQPTASARSTSGDSGFVGGSLPVLFFQIIVMAFFATNPPANAAAPAITRQPMSPLSAIFVLHSSVSPTLPERSAPGGGGAHRAGNWHAACADVNTIGS